MKTSVLARALLSSSILFGVGRAATVNYTLVITDAVAAPDGVSRPVLHVNGQTPGPLLIADEGDTLNVVVVNLAGNATTVHWHGMQQSRTPWSDGVPGITQRGITPGANFTYTFTASPAGMHWYHSHSHFQLDNGLKGPFYVRPNPRNPKPFANITSNEAELTAILKAENNSMIIFAHDWKHRTADFYQQEWDKTQVEQLCIDSVLVNGKGQVHCPTPAAVASFVPAPFPGERTNKTCILPGNPALYPPYPESNASAVDASVWFECTNTTTPLEVFTVNKQDQWAAFNYINAGSLYDLKVSIDSHTMVVFASAGQYTSLQFVESAVISPGERLSFLVKLDQPEDSYAIRVASTSFVQYLSGYAILSYNNSTNTTTLHATVLPTAKRQWINYDASPVDPNLVIDLNHTQLRPFPAHPPPIGKSDRTIMLTINRTASEQNTLGGTAPFPASEETSVPVLFDTAENQKPLLDAGVAFEYPNGSLVDLIIHVAAPAPGHPIHKHGVKGWLLGAGQGRFPYPTIDDAVQANFSAINIFDPPRTDSYSTLAPLGDFSWLAVRYRAVDPGPTLLHCHLEPHLDTGMAVLLLEGMDHLPDIPPAYRSAGNISAAAKKSENAGNPAILLRSAETYAVMAALAAITWGVVPL